MARIAGPLWKPTDPSEQLGFAKAWLQLPGASVALIADLVREILARQKPKVVRTLNYLNAPVRQALAHVQACAAPPVEVGAGRA